MRGMTLSCLTAGLLLLSGCSKSGPTVKGIVRLDGQLLPTGWIKFVPIAGTPGPDAGARIEEGEYQIDKGLREGAYRVEIQATQTMPQMVFDPAGPGARVHKQKLLVPPEFNQNSKLIEKVHAGSNRINFEVNGFENKGAKKAK